MFGCIRRDLVDLLARLAYSTESGHVLWDANDRVQDKYYVVLRKYNDEFIGNHIALEQSDIRMFEGGECRSYSVSRGTCAGEHLIVYLYNPEVCANGVLPLTLRTTDGAAREAETRVTHVQPDTCVPLCVFPVASMQRGHVTDLSIGAEKYRVLLSIAFG